MRDTGGCSVCGDTLPEGRLYTCGDVCEAAHNENVDEYIKAKQAERLGLGGPALEPGCHPVTGIPYGSGSPVADPFMDVYRAWVAGVSGTLKRPR